MSKPKFAIDVDSTLYDFNIPAREAFLKLSIERGDRSLLRGVYSPWTEWRSQVDSCGEEAWQEVIDMCHQPHVILAQTPYPGAVETCQALANAGYEIMYISNRDDGDTAIATYEWLAQHAFPFPSILKCIHGTKIPYLTECQYLIDDRPRTLIDFVYDREWTGPKRKGLSITYPYNQALTDIEDIFLAPTWSGLAAWMVRKGILDRNPHSPLET
jgi:5'(3')-deoxyribonucleotidase